MTELLVVVAIIAIAAAVSLPLISNYLKHYKIKGAAQQVAGEIQSARAKAISKNVNLGVVFLTLSPNTYQWVIEDDLDPTDSDGFRTTRAPLSSILVEPVPAEYAAQVGPRQTLPAGVVFSQGCPSLPAGGAWEQGFRFNRLGAWCSPDATDANCPSLAFGAAFVFNAAASGAAQVESAGGVVCIAEASTGLFRTVRVMPGGRVLPQP